MEVSLSIAIPTFNRLGSLQQTLLSLGPLRNENNLEILVLDNCSDDGTWEWLCLESENLGITAKRNPFDLGLEGNIIQALTLARGKYVWLLSDHMVVQASEVSIFLEKLRAGLTFTLGYARIATYETVLPKIYTISSLEDIDKVLFWRMIFFMSNISAFIVNRNHLYKCYRSLFRFSCYSYPHLGVFVHVSKDDTFVELPPISSFAAGDPSKPKCISYDTFRSRFIGYVRAIKEIRRLNPQVSWSHQALNIRHLLGALVYDAISSLCREATNRVGFNEFAFCLRHYPGKIRFFLLLCIILSLIPHKFRTAVSKMIFRALLPKLYTRAMVISEGRFSAESIIE